MPALPTHSAACTPMPATVLELDGFGVAYGERTVLSGVTLTVPECGILTLLGPAGTGKSTLVRTLAGFNASNPSLRTWGTARFAGAPLGSGPLPALVAQSARLMIASILENVVNDLPERGTLTLAQQRDLAARLLAGAGLAEYSERLDEPVVQLPLAVQRHIAILRLAAAGPRLLCIDEPTTGLPEAEADALLDYIQAESRRRAVLVVLHNQAQAQRLGGEVALLAGGAIQEMRPAPQFFAAPRTAPAREFVRMGTCCLPSPDACAEELDADVAAPAARPEVPRPAVSHAFGPRGFLWLKNGVLAGTPRPGIFFDTRYDLAALQRVGVTVLVSLTRTPPEEELLPEFGIRCLRSPIPDMEAPTLDQAVELCRTIERLIANNEVVAVHCRAGLGRTGTVLASVLIWEGATALAALDTVRRIEPRWVQSEPQVAFLAEFARHVANTAGAPRTGKPSAVLNDNR